MGSRRTEPVPFAGNHHHRAWSLDGEKDPIVSAALCFTAPLLDLRLSPGSSRSLRPGCVPYISHGRANPHDLDADFPVASRVSTVRRMTVGLPLLGLSKERPSIVPCRRVRLPGSTSPFRPSGSDRRPSRVPPSWFLTTSAVFSSPTVQVSFTLLPILGFTAFLFVAKRRSPQRWSCPPKLSLRRQRRVRRESVLVGARHVRAIAGSPFTARLALSPFPSESGKMVSHFPTGSPPSAFGAGASGPCSIVGSVAAPPVSGRGCPVLPWA
jgi:hypothetical protein